MRLKIKSDGTIQGTRVFTEDGKELTHVTGIHFWASATQEPTVEVRMLVTEVELEAEGIVFRRIHQSTEGERAKLAEDHGFA